MTVTVRLDSLADSPGEVDADRHAESTIGLFKTELIELQGPWCTRTVREFVVLKYVNWFNTGRLGSELGHLTPTGTAED